MRSREAFAPKSFGFAPALSRASNELSVSPWWWYVTFSCLIRENRSFCAFVLFLPAEKGIGEAVVVVVVVVMAMGVDMPETEAGMAAMGMEMVVVGETFRFLAVWSSSEEELDDDEEEDEEEDDEVEGDRTLRFWPATGVATAAGAGVVIFAT